VSFVLSNLQMAQSLHSTKAVRFIGRGTNDERKMAYLAAEFRELLNLRRVASAKGPPGECSPQRGEPTQGRTERARLRGSAEPRRKIEANFGCAQVG
jgi:hypothetical protein